MNWGARSEVIVEGTANQEIHVLIRAEAQSVVAVEERGMASGLWEVQSITVRRKV